jgi:2-C-methyl-D-erythritol 2,4-cyclodiphosphate synthase
MSYRIGFGIDFHQLTEGRKLILGGVHIPFEKGAMGHSDADVLLHAICDALLGALNLGDIGVHFPDTENEFKNIDSRILLQRIFAMVREKNYCLVNMDATICLEMPKIRKYSDGMRKVIGDILETDPDNISIKATTTEKMGFIGRGEGIVAYATLLLEKI